MPRKKRADNTKRLEGVVGQPARIQPRLLTDDLPSGGLIVDAHLRLDRLTNQLALSWTREDFFWLLDTLRVLAPTSSSICARVAEILANFPDRALTDASPRIVNACADLLWLHRGSSAAIEKILALLRRLQKLNLRCFDDMRLVSGVVASLSTETKSTVKVACTVIAAFCRAVGNATVMNKLFASGCLEKLISAIEGEIFVKQYTTRRRDGVSQEEVSKSSPELSIHLGFLLEALEALITNHDASLRLFKLHKTEKRTAVFIVLEAFNKSRESPVAATAVCLMAVKLAAVDPTVLTDTELVNNGESLTVNLGKGVRLERFNTFADAIADALTRHRDAPDVILPACEALVSLDADVDVSKLRTALNTVIKIEKSQIDPVSERLKAVLPPINKPPLQFPASPRWIGRARVVIAKLSALIAKLAIKQKQAEVAEAQKVETHEVVEEEELDEEVVENAVNQTLREILGESETKVNGVSLSTDEKSNVTVIVDLEVANEKFPLLAKALSMDPREMKEKIASRLSWKPRLVETPIEQVRRDLGTLSMKMTVPE